MIKAGQIYQTERLEKFAVTRVIGPQISVITPHGIVALLSEISCDNELIAEYPTWQEAVNSKEFKGVER